MEYPIIPDEEALRKCAWCRKHILDNAEVFSVGVKLKPSVDLTEYEGHCIEIGLVADENPLYMLVTLAGSEAKQEGNDGMFLICSEKCGKEIKRALERELSIGKFFETFRF